MEFLQSWGHLIIGAIQLLFAAILVPVWRAVSKVRTNDLAHIDTKISEVRAAVKEVRDEQRLLVERMDRHLEWHASEKR